MSQFACSLLEPLCSGVATEQAASLGGLLDGCGAVTTRVACRARRNQNDGQLRLSSSARGGGRR